jgi:acetolactate decarboxylase
VSGEQAADRFRAWAGAILARHLHRARDSSAEHPVSVYQTSTMAALLDGIYDGDVTIAELLTHGDFGLGTFNHLDGEMVVLDGTCYHLRADGSATIASGQDKTPFAAVLWFRPDRTITVTDPADRAALTGLIDSAIPSPNLTYAVRISGSFARVRTRTVMVQRQPYPPLAQATAHEPVTDLAYVTGTLAGFRTPAYEQGISVAGYHLHFLTQDRHRGGHALDFALDHGEVTICTASELHLSLPRTGPFLSADLSPTDTNAKIKQIEDDRPSTEDS